MRRYVGAALLTAVLCFAAITRTNWINQIGNKPVLDSREYVFAPIAPGGTLAAANPATVTLPTCPPGVVVGDDLYISGGTGTPETVFLTASTCVAGSIGTVSFTPANSHSGAWAVKSATCGVQEAELTLTAGATILMPPGVCKFYGPVVKPSYPIFVKGSGKDATVISVSAVGFGDAVNFPLTQSGVFQMVDFVLLTSGTASGGISDLTVRFYQDMTITMASAAIHWPAFVNAQHVQKPIFERIKFQGAWDGFVVYGDQGINCEFCDGSWFHRAFDVDGITDSSVIHAFHGWPGFGLSGNALNVFMYDPAVVGFWIGQADDFKVTDSALDPGTTADIHLGLAGSAHPPWITFSAVDMDNGRFQMHAGKAFISNGTVIGANTNIAFNGIATAAALTYTGGELFVSDSTVGTSDVANTAIPIDINYSTSGFPNDIALAAVHFSNVRFYNNRDTITVNEHTTGANAGVMMINGSHFMIPNAISTTYASCVISANGQIKAIVTGNDFTSKSDHTGNFFCADTDSGHVVKNNSATAWSITYPALMFFSKFSDNSGITNPDPAATAVVAAGTIFPTGPFFHVTGSTSIGTISPTSSTLLGTATDPAIGDLYIVFDSNPIIVTGGNIAIGFTAVPHKGVRFRYDYGTSLWYPSGF